MFGVRLVEREIYLRLRRGVEAVLQHVANHPHDLRALVLPEKPDDPTPYHRPAVRDVRTGEGVVDEDRLDRRRLVAWRDRAAFLEPELQCFAIPGRDHILQRARDHRLTSLSGSEREPRHKG